MQDRRFPLPEYSDDLSDNFPILVGNRSFSLVTCSSLTQVRINYWGYLKPFSVRLLGYAILNAALEMGLIVVEKSSSTLIVMFRSPTSLKLIALWTLASFVVVDIYKSIVTEDTTAPFVSSPPKMFDQLVNGGFHIYSGSTRKLLTTSSIPQTRTNWRAVGSEFDLEIFFHYIKWTKSLSAELMVAQIQVEFLKQEFGRITQIFKVINASRISGIVARCNKTAFVAPSIYIKSRQFLLNILGGKKSHLSRKPYLETSDTIFPSRAYILVTKLGPIGDRFKGRIAKIIEGGFYQFWEDLDWDWEEKTDFRKVNNFFSPLYYSS
ncbi:hypothetical protein Fcan01_26473 [Folsomia candida]|uniref:Uncharacterized protein n=1 Tax=Folsomia candida TaxID=158441 RepID=A0A226D1V8_FOLCA|nr:hypothetical protein Fcan01_26473 [Folsomia candida]